MSQQQDHPANPSGGAGHRVLVVDDATVVRLYYRQILEREGYLVVEAINGLEALELALLDPVSLVIVDLNMPVMDGLTFLRTLRREPAIRAVPVLMTTTEAQPADRLAALGAGANGYLTKPLAARDLVFHAAALIGEPGGPRP